MFVDCKVSGILSGTDRLFRRPVVLAYAKVIEHGKKSLIDVLQVVSTDFQKFASVAVCPNAALAGVKEENRFGHLGGNVGEHPVQKSERSVE